MNYLRQLWYKFRCKHDFKYAMRISSQGEQLRVFECSRCFAVKYEKVDVNEID